MRAGARGLRALPAARARAGRCGTGAAEPAAAPAPAEPAAPAPAAPAPAPAAPPSMTSLLPPAPPPAPAAPAPAPVPPRAGPGAPDGDADAQARRRDGELPRRSGTIAAAPPPPAPAPAPTAGAAQAEAPPASARAPVYYQPRAPKRRATAASWARRSARATRGAASPCPAGCPRAFAHAPAAVQHGKSCQNGARPQRAPQPRGPRRRALRACARSTTTARAPVRLRARQVRCAHLRGRAGQVRSCSTRETGRRVGKADQGRLGGPAGEVRPDAAGELRAHAGAARALLLDAGPDARRAARTYWRAGARASRSGRR